MAKKREKSVELSAQNITFDINQTSYKLIRFYPSRMNLDAMVYENGVKEGVKSIGFAMLPKHIKQIVKPM
ncbi:MAG: hypothetical protein IE916_09460 [Epsilonproteobacteria bacterium]|nr:hypothetical protein [Campylobacterota bacterium]